MLIVDDIETAGGNEAGGNDTTRLVSASAHVGNTHLGTGTLCIAESCVTWTSDECAAQSRDRRLVLQYPSIVLHAVSRDTSTFATACLYLMVDKQVLDDVADVDERGSPSSSPSVDSQSSMSEVRFVPSDLALLDAMFARMSHCQSLHPGDNCQSASDDGDIDEFDDDDADLADVCAPMHGVRIDTDPDETQETAPGQIGRARNTRATSNGHLANHQFGNGTIDGADCTEMDQFADAE